MHPTRGSIELRPVQARIGSSPDARTPARQRRGVTNRRGGAGKRVPFASQESASDVSCPLDADRMDVAHPGGGR